MWRYKQACVFILATVTVQVLATYFVRDDKTRWENAICSLAEPQLAYINASIYVQENISSPSEGLWIGYRQAKLPFIFIGFHRIVSGTVYMVTSIGYCFNACGGGPFGIQPVGDNAILFDPTPKQCLCGSTIMMASNCRQQTSQDSNINNTNCAAIFTSIDEAGEVFPDDSSTDGDCMLYYFPRVKWGKCTVQSSPIKVMCSNRTYTDSSATAVIVDEQSTYNWIDGNALCLAKNMYPVSGKSIQRGGFTNANTQSYWTGIIRSTAILKKSTVGDKSIYQIDQFAFVEDMQPDLKFADKHKTKSSLCITQDTATTSTVSTTSGISTTLSTQEQSTSNSSIYQDKATTTTVSTTSGISTTLSTQKLSTPNSSTPYGSSSEKTSPGAVSVGIGVAVGLLCAVGAVVVIIVLRRRGVSSCKMGTNTEKPNHRNSILANRRSHENKSDDVGDNHFILDKVSQSAANNADHYSTAGEPNEDKGGADNYYSIEDTEQQYPHVNDNNADYDYTTNALTTGPYTTKPENVYNKLKADQPSEYDHLGRNGHNAAVAGNDYAISAAIAQRNDDLSEYNHIPRDVGTTLTRGYVTKDFKHGDYDVIKGMQVKRPHGDASDYAHVKNV